MRPNFNEYVLSNFVSKLKSECLLFFFHVYNQI